jgi:hypothetical protein
VSPCLTTEKEEAKSECKPKEAAVEAEMKGDLKEATASESIECTTVAKESCNDKECAEPEVVGESL